MNSNKVDSSISSMLIAPTIGIAVFSIFFIIYAHNAFIKSRKSEFGLFMVLGMSYHHIRKIIVLENTIIAILSIITGLLSGTIFSGLFYNLITKILIIKGVPFELTYQCYLNTIILYIFIYIIMIVTSIITTMRYDIVKLLKENRKDDKNLITIGPIISVIGIFLIILAITVMKINIKLNDTVKLCCSLASCFIGIYLIISNLVWLLDKLYQLFPILRQKNILFLANLKYTFGQSKKILFLITVFVYITVFFSGISLFLMQQSHTLAIEYNPYHIDYAEIFGLNKISDNELNTIIGEGTNKLESSKTIEFVNYNNFMILSEKTLNDTLGYDISVTKGHYFLLYQYIKDDGYTHDISQINSLDISIDDTNTTYYLQGTVCKVLFNNISIYSGAPCVILDDEDYINLKSKTNQLNIGKVHLLNFKGWKNTGYIVKGLQKKLESINKTEGEVNYLAIPTSRIVDYDNRMAAASFMLFLCGFVGILFFISSCVIMHFKLLTEMERERRKYRKLYKIGITSNEIKTILKKELKVLFFLPIIIGIITAIFYGYSLYVNSSGGLTSLKESTTIGMIYIIIQLVFYNIYKRWYIGRILKVVS